MRSDSLKVVIKNCNRNIDTNLTAKSVKYFLPNSEIYLFNIYKYEIDYNNLDIELYKEIVDIKTKYILGHGFSSENNGLYYTEGFNLIFDYFKDYNDKLLILDENHFFTNGNTLKEIIENVFDIASPSWYGGDGDIKIYNASIICFNPQKVKNFFPLPEIKMFIEDLLKKYLYSDENLNFYLIKNRKFTDYFGDGVYTNKHTEMYDMMKKNNII